MRHNQEIEYNGKRYMIAWKNEEVVYVQVKTKSGWHTLNGHGRANRGIEMNTIIHAYPVDTYNPFC